MESIPVIAGADTPAPAAAGAAPGGPAPRQTPSPPSPSLPSSPPVAPDLRRRGARNLAEQVVRRAAHLPMADRTLLHAVFRDGRPVAQVARARGEHPARLCARVRRLMRRLNDPAYLYVASHRAAWSPTMLAVASAHFLHGEPMRAVAARTGLSFHEVRRHRDAVLALAAEWAHRARAGERSRLARPPRAGTPAPSTSRAATPGAGGGADGPDGGARPGARPGPCAEGEAA
jgi:hypothetical protein